MGGPRNMEADDPKKKRDTDEVEDDEEGDILPVSTDDQLSASTVVSRLSSHEASPGSDAHETLKHTRSEGHTHPEELSYIGWKGDDLLAGSDIREEERKAN